MKKSLNRALSLLLAVIMLLGVMPVALADETELKPATGIALDLTTLTMVVGESATLNATVTPEGSTDTLTWTSSDERYVTVENGVVTAVKAGSATVTVYSNEHNDVEATCEVTVYEDSAKVTISGAPTGEVEVGASFQLTAVVEPEGASQTVTWKSSDNSVLTPDANGLIKAVKAGTATITAEAFGGAVSDPVEITVVDPQYSITLDKSELTLVLNSGAESAYQLKATVKKGETEVTAEELAALKLTWSMAETVKSVTLKDGLVTAVKATQDYPVEITATITNPNTKKTYSAVCQVTVLENDIQIVQGNVSTLDSAYTFKPTLADKDGKAITNATNVVYTYKLNGVANDATITFTEAGGSTSGYGEHEVEISVTATVGGKTVKASKTVYLAFARDIDIKVTLKTGKTAVNFEEQDIFSYIKIGTGTAITNAVALAAESFENLMVELTTREDAKFFDFTGSTATAKIAEITTGSNSGVVAVNSAVKDVHINTLDSVLLTMKDGASGIYTFTYTVKSENGVVLATGSFDVTGAGEGKITYDAAYNTPVSFVYEDFSKFWNDSKAVTGTLTYVDFGVSQSTAPYVPDYGTLYTTNVAKDQTNANKVTSSMKFTKSASASYKDLDLVTFVPVTSDRTAYTVEIPFVAHGTNSQALAGTVVISVNGANTSITSRGVKFGTSISGLLAEDFKDNTKAELAYVYFTLPKVEDGRLLYTSAEAVVTDMSRVDEKTPYYYVVDGSDADKTTDKEIAELEKEKKSALNCVFFIPAAGKTGKVTVEYIAYDATGSSKYEGKLTLDISAKKASDKFKDVNANSYSWAADSIDFLYYEGVVNGDDKGNYNPKNSITRGDFMLMLYRAFLSDEYGEDDFTVTSNFTDVPDNKNNAYVHETYNAIGVAKYLGIAQGDGVSYRPKDKISREEAMTLIHRTLDKIGLKLEYATDKDATKFPDYKNVSKYAQTPITELVSHGIVAGDDKGNLNPKANITRAEMAVILHRVLTY